MKNNALTIVLLLIVFTGIGFFAGTKYQQSKTPSFATGQNARGQFAGINGTGTGAAGGANARGRMNGGQIRGEILSSDAKSITVKLTDGSTKIVLLGINPTINKAAEATTADLKIGATVSIFGTTNTDGSVTAQNIQLNPTMIGRPSGTPSGAPANQ